MTEKRRGEKETIIMVKKVIPKLIIQYSGIYDQQIRSWQGKEFKPCVKEALSYCKKLQQKWDTIGNKAFASLSSVSGLEWQKPIIDCWVVQRTRPFSMPLTIPMREDVDKMLEILIHELVHNLIVQNSDRIKKGYPKRYEKFSRLTRIHILVHAILHETLLEIYGKKQTEVFIKGYDRIRPDYKIAWDVVKEEGAKNIIKECIKK